MPLTHLQQEAREKVLKKATTEIILEPVRMQGYVEGYAQAIEDAKGAVPEENKTENIGIANSVIKIAWNDCRQQTLANLNELIK